MTEELTITTRRTVRLWDLPLVFVAPRRLFGKVEDVGAYGWTLVVLLLAVTLLGYGMIETGLIDREVDRMIETGIAELEKQQFDVVERSALSEMIKEQRKAGEFLRMVTRIQHVAVMPIATLATILLLGSIFYGVVALTGRKPEWHTLLTVLTFASFIDLLGLIVRFGFMLRFARLDVDTSFGTLGRWLLMRESIDAQSALLVTGLLSGLDPFRIWFWFIVVVGLSVTSQLRGWKVWSICVLFWVLAALMRTGAMYAAVFGAQQAAQMQK